MTGISDFLRLPPPPPFSIGDLSSTFHQLLKDVIPDWGVSSSVSLRLQLHRGIRYTVYSIQYTVYCIQYTVYRIPLCNCSLKCSTDSIFMFSNVMVWLGLSVCMCFGTSDTGKNPAFTPLSKARLNYTFIRAVNPVIYINLHWLYCYVDHSKYGPY